MKDEIAAAVVFLCRILRQNDNIAKEKVDNFSDSLSAILVDRFKNHWYKDRPSKGQGYRCIRINPAEPVDPVLEKATTDSGLQYSDLNLPLELTLWVDPEEVCCR
jgi:protein Tob/BTG